MNEAVWVWDKNEKTIYANPKFCELVWKDLDSILWVESYEFWDSDSGKRVKYENTNYRKRWLNSSYEWRLIGKNNKTIPVLLNWTPLPDWWSIWIMTDLRVLKKKEELEQILSKSISYAPSAIIIFDDQEHIKLWNKWAKIIFWYREWEMNNNIITKIFSKEEINPIIDHSNNIHIVELYWRHKNWNNVKVSATLTKISWSFEDSASYYLIIARDISAESKLEEELASKYHKIREAYNQFWIIKRQMDYIFEFIDIFNEADNIKTLWDYIVTSVIMLTRIDTCVLKTYNSKTSYLELMSYFWAVEWWSWQNNVKFKGSLAEKAYLQNSPLKILDLTKEPKLQSLHLARNNNLCSLLLIPLVSRWQFIWSLYLYTSLNKKIEIFENDFIEKYAKVIEVVLWSYKCKSNLQ